MKASFICYGRGFFVQLSLTEYPMCKTALRLPLSLSLSLATKRPCLRQYLGPQMPISSLFERKTKPGFCIIGWWAVNLLSVLYHKPNGLSPTRGVVGLYIILFPVFRFFVVAVVVCKLGTYGWRMKERDMKSWETVFLSGAVLGFGWLGGGVLSACCSFYLFYFSSVAMCPLPSRP